MPSAHKRRPLEEPEARKLRDEFESILEAAGEGIYGVDNQGRTTFMNPTAVELLGLEGQEIIGTVQHVVSHHSHPDGTPYRREECPIYRAFKDGQVHQVTDEVFWRADGTSLPVEYTSTPIREGGRVVGAVVVFRDVSARRQAEEALRRRSKELEEAQRLAHIGSWRWDLPSRHVSWSDELYRIYGLDPERDELSFEEFLQAVHPDDRDRVRAVIDETIESGTTFDFEARVLRPDGEVRHLRSRGETVTDDGGRPIWLVGTCQDITDHKAAEERQRQLLREQVARAEAEANERRTANLLESITDAFFALDTAMRFTYVNGEAERLFGRSREELVGASVAKAFPDEVDSGLWRVCREAIEGHKPFDFEEYHEPRRAWYAVRAYPRDDGLSVYFRDITARRHIEQELRESQARFRFLAESIPPQIWTADPDGQLDYVNQRVEDYFGSDSDVLGEGWQEFVHPDDLPETVEIWGASLQTGEPYEAEFRLRRHDGAYRWHLCRAQARTDDDGRILKWFGSNTDIDDWKRAEAARDEALAVARVQRRRLRDLFEQAPAAIAVVYGSEHVFESANPRYLELLGGRDILGKPIAEAFPELAGQGFFELLDHVYETGEPYVGTEVRAVLGRRDDQAPQESYFNFVYQPLLDDDGVYGVMIHAVDVTDQVRARKEVEDHAAELSRITSALERSNAELDQFAYVASHDLKAPLRGISNLSTWLEEDLEGALDDETRHNMDLLRNRVQRMESLIDGILAYSRAGRLRYDPEDVDTAGLVRETIDLLSPPEHVQFEVADDMPRFTAALVPLQQVFQNLISNAVKHSDVDAPRVRISCRPRSQGYEFTVKDNGPGIPRAYQHKIWGIFQTLKAHDQIEGTGIGLSLVKKIVETRGGDVWVESEPGHGAAFHFTWPDPEHEEAPRVR